MQLYAKQHMLNSQIRGANMSLKFPYYKLSLISSIYDWIHSILEHLTLC